MTPQICASWTSVAVLESHQLACLTCHVRVSSSCWQLGRWEVVAQPSSGSHSLLPPDLEQLHLGLYGMSDRLILIKEGSPLLTQKWCHSLRELDLSGQGFIEKDLEQALAAFSTIPGSSHPPLCSLNLRGTRVTPSTVRSAPLCIPQHQDGLLPVLLGSLAY